jgi:hypothetical protein
MDGTNRVKVLNPSFEENAVLRVIAVQRRLPIITSGSLVKACISESA